MASLVPFSISSSSIAYAVTDSGTSMPVTLTLTNSGNAAVTIYSTSITGSNATQFSVAPGGATPCASLKPTLGAGTSCTLNVTFAPTSTGDKAAALRLISDDEANPTLQTLLSGRGTDISAPRITAFSVPATSVTFNVPITAFSATDNILVTGYLLTESATSPLKSAADWTAAAPVSYNFTSTGRRTLYAWAKDALGNVSPSALATTFVDLNKPAVTAFTMPAIANSLTIPVPSFSAADDQGISGYLITTSPAVPLASASVPLAYSFAPDTPSGAYTLYAWVKDYADNISLMIPGAPVAIDVTVPVITNFALAPYISSLTVPVSTFSATDAAGNVSLPASASVTFCTISAGSDANGNISLPGLSYYACNQNRLYKITPKPGYQVADVLVDGISAGKVSYQLFSAVSSSASHTIAATFELDPLANWYLVAPGLLHTIAIRADGTMWAWGGNSNNQLGDGTATSRYNPVRVTAYSDWQFGAAGARHSLGRRANGNLYGWGSNDSGQLGSSGTKLPALIDGSTGWLDLYASDAYSLARNSDGSFKQLGASPAGSAAAAPATEWIALASGIDHCAALRADGTLWSWGANSAGQLGDASVAARTSPVRPGSATNWVQVAAGSAHSAGLQTNGSLWTWGDNSMGQLGTDQIPGYSVAPVQIGTGQSWKSVATGDNHTLALRADGTLWAFGDNGSGQLGDGSGATTNYLVQVGTDSDWKSISAHGNLSYGIKNDNTLYAWGANSSGQLGDNTVVDKLTPVLVGTSTSSFVIAATSSSGGSISPSGAITAASGSSKTFAAAPLAGWHISDVVVDGVSRGAIASYAFTSVADRHSISARFAQNTATSFSLHVTLAGTGSGSVHSSPIAISCITGSDTGCSASFPSGTVVTLTAGPDRTSVADGWSDACSGSLCAITMNNDKNATVGFSLAPKVKLNLNDSTGFNLLSDAYSNASSTIYALDTALTGGWTLNASKYITLIGGYQADYAKRTGFTVLSGNLTIKSGSLRIDGLILGP